MGKVHADAMTLRIDAHHHLWDLAARPQPWMVGADMTPLRRNFGVADLTAALAGHDIDGTVVVQTVADITETEELLDLAEVEPLIAGVVGYVDVAAPDIDEQLDRLRHRASGRWLVGVRSLVQYETDPGWLSRPAVVAGLRAVASRDLVHDLLILPHQIDAAIEAVSVVEGGTFVVDHLATGHFSLEDAAHKLCMSSRTLGRRLSEEGTTFKNVVDDMRKAVALRYVAGHDLGLSEVALLAGFTETPSFYRAFRRWTGMTPSQYRWKHRGDLRGFR
jgi:predicted TIM-barrel fold metal-dependent hydrolase